MEYLLSFIHPDVSLFLNVALVHAMQFEKIIPKKKEFRSSAAKQMFLKKAIAQEKGKIITTLSKDKIAIVNIDDPLILAQAKKSSAKIYFFGKKGDMKILAYKISSRGTSFIYQYDGKRVELKLPYLLPEYYGYTFSGALLTGVILGLSFSEVINSLKKNFILPSGRSKYSKNFGVNLISLVLPYFCLVI